MLAIVAAFAGMGALPLAIEPTSPEIYGGEEVVDDNDEAGTVAIRSGEVLCTGTVVQPDLVITAAHCILNGPAPEDPTAFGIYFGKSVTVPNVPFVIAQQVGVHPDYGGPDCLKDCYDLAYLVPSSPINVDLYAPPFSSQDEYDTYLREGSTVRLVGYGRDEQGVVGIKRTVVTEVKRFTGSGKEFFAGGDGKDSCLGDSGGPAFIELPDGSRRLAGVLSRGEECGEGGIYGNPYAAACWIREETGIDLTDGCDACDCVRLSKKKKHDDGCSVVDSTASTPPGLLTLLAPVLLGSVAAIRRRRRRKNPAMVER